MATRETPQAKALADALDRGRRVRLQIGERKMKLPGVVMRAESGGFQLKSNWGKVYDIPADDTLREVEVADGSGRYQPITA